MPGAITDKPNPLGDPEATQAPLPADRAFVIQLRAQPSGDDPFVGRAEHIASGATARFHSSDDLLAFLRSMLAPDAPPGEAGRPGAGPEDTDTHGARAICESLTVCFTRDSSLPPRSEEIAVLFAPETPGWLCPPALAAVLLLVAVPASAQDRVDGTSAAGRRWEVHVSTGLLYDSNVTLDPSGQQVPGTVADPADGAISVGAGGSFDLLKSDRAQIGLEYDLYQNLHFRLQDFNLLSNRVQGTAGYSLLPELWVGTQVGYQHYALGGSGYSSEPFVTPFVSLVESGWGLSQLLYRHGEVTYLSPPFEDVRDGPTDAVSLSQTFYWGTRTATIGYEWGRERPRSSAPLSADYRYRYNQVYAGFAFTPGWQTSIELVYVFRYENYTEPNTFAADQRRRQDHINQVAATVQRPIAPHFSIGLSYYGTFDASNIDVFEYDRHIVQAELRFSY
jgi:hypothetical protein